MKLKWWLLILLCLNALVLAWQWDAFAPWGYGPQVHREPERLQQQIRPESMQLERLPLTDAVPGSAPPSSAAEQPGTAADAPGEAPVGAAVQTPGPAASGPASASPAPRP